MDDLRVISSELDGADLRREKGKNSRHLRCDGKNDDAEINDAIQGSKGKGWSLPSQAWDRIFGGKT